MVECLMLNENGIVDVVNKSSPYRSVVGFKQSDVLLKSRTVCGHHFIEKGCRTWRIGR